MVWIPEEGEGIEEFRDLGIEELRNEEGKFIDLGILGLEIIFGKEACWG